MVQSTSVTISFVIDSLLQVNPTQPPNGVVGQPYSFQFTATGGKAPYVWAVAVGSNLPAGLNLTSDGLLSGTPTAGGNASFTINVHDSGV